MLKITMHGVERAPRWRTMERIIRQTVKSRWCQKPRLVRISRPDGGADYRGLGVYELTVECTDGSQFPCVLEVQ